MKALHLPRALHSQWMAMLFVVILSALLLVGLPQASAAAAPAGSTHASSALLPAKILDDSDPVGKEYKRAYTPNACGSVTGVMTSDPSQFLPINRWKDGTGNIHTNLDNTFFKAAAQVIQREGITGMTMSVANVLWSATNGFATIAINFCPLNKAGAFMDNWVGNLGKMIGLKGGKSGAAVLAALMVAAILIALFQGRRRGFGFAFKQIFSKAAVIGLLVVMVSGAAASTGGQGDSDYVPGKLSPGWIVTKMNSMLGSVASVPADALYKVTNPAPGKYTGGDSASLQSCDRYINTLHTLYRDQYPTAAKAQSTVMASLSTMWEDSVMQSWKRAQFGDYWQDSQGNIPKNSPGDLAYCHVLEWKSSTPLIDARDGDGKLNLSFNPNSTSVVNVLARTQIRSKATGTVPKDTRASLQEAVENNSQLLSPTDNENEDRAIMDWAFCQVTGDKLTDGGSDPKAQAGGSFRVNDLAFDKYDRGSGPRGKIIAQYCAQSFRDNGKAGGEIGEAFEFDIKPNDVSEHSKSPQLTSFINTVHGYEGGSAGIGVAIAAAISGLFLFGVFGIFNVVMMVVKFLLVLQILKLFIAAVMGLLPGHSFAKFIAELKKTFGICVGIMGIQLLYSVIAGMSQMITGWTGGGTGFADVLMAGLAPGLVIFMLAMIFKSMKLPNPFTPTGAMAWGHGLQRGAAGAALGGGMMMMGKRMASKMAREKLGGAAKGLLSRTGKGATPGLTKSPQELAAEVSSRPGSARGALERQAAKAQAKPDPKLAEMGLPLDGLPADEQAMPEPLSLAKDPEPTPEMVPPAETEPTAAPVAGTGAGALPPLPGTGSDEHGPELVPAGSAAEKTAAMAFLAAKNDETRAKRRHDAAVRREARRLGVSEDHIRGLEEAGKWSYEDGAENPGIRARYRQAWQGFQSKSAGRKVATVAKGAAVGAGAVVAASALAPALAPVILAGGAAALTLRPVGKQYGAKALEGVRSTAERASTSSNPLRRAGARIVGAGSMHEAVNDYRASALRAESARRAAAEAQAQKEQAEAERKQADEARDTEKQDRYKAAQAERAAQRAANFRQARIDQGFVASEDGSRLIHPESKREFAYGADEQWTETEASLMARRPQPKGAGQGRSKPQAAPKPHARPAEPDEYVPVNNVEPDYDPGAAEWNGNAQPSHQQVPAGATPRHNNKQFTSSPERRIRPNATRGDGTEAPPPQELG